MIDQHLIPLPEATKLGYGSVSTLRRRIKNGTLPAVKVRGTQLRVNENDLRAMQMPAVPSTEQAYLQAAKAIAAAAPALTPQQKAGLAALLAR